MQRTRLTAFFSPRKIEFDTEYMYVKRSAGEEKIPLENISAVLMTIIKVGSWFIYKVKYTSTADHTEKAVLFLPQITELIFYKTLDDFRKRVKEKNPKVDLGDISGTTI